MSFILDALRKSENERQRAAIPGIGDVPPVVHRTRVPGWIIGVIAGLVGCVIVLAWAWMSDTGPVTVQSPTAAVSTPPPAQQPQQRAEVRSLAGEARQSSVQTPATPTPSGPAATTAAVAPAPAPAPAPSPQFSEPLLTLTELQAAGVSVPNLNLELHVFSSVPADRFVFINSIKYREGEDMPEGTRILGITEDGVVLDLRGVTFLLPRE